MCPAHPNYSSRMILRMGVDVPLVLMCLIPSDVWLAPPFVPRPSKTCKTTSYSSAPLNWASKVDLDPMLMLMNFHDMQKYAFLMIFCYKWMKKAFIMSSQNKSTDKFF